MHDKKRLVQNISSLGAVQLINYVFPLLTVPIITRIIGPDKFGVINYAAAFISYFTLFINYAFDLTATRKLTRDVDNQALRNRVFSEVFYCQALLFCVSCAVFAVCLYHVRPLAEEKRVALYSFTLCISTLLTQNWLFQAMQELPKLAILNFVSKLLYSILIVILIRQKDDYAWQPLVLSGAQIIISIISFVWAFKRFHLSWVKVRFARLFELLWEDRMVFFSFVVINLYTTTNIVILGFFSSEAGVGYYTAGQRLNNIVITVINLPLSQAFYPFIGQAFAKSREAGIQTVQKSLPVVFMLTLVASVGMLVLGPPVMSLFYGHKFAPAIPVFLILSPAPIIIALSNLFGIQVMLNLKMDKAMLAISTVGAVLGITLNIVLIHFFDYIGTAINWIIVEVYITLAFYIYLRRQGIEAFQPAYFRMSAFKNQLQPLLSRIKNKKS
jgi:PST family polysaccharide transporter